MLKALTLCLYYLQVGNYVSGLPGGQLAKESACNAGDLRSIPGLGRSPGEGNGYPLQWSWGFSGGSDDKENASNAGNLGLIPGSGRCPGKGMATCSSILLWRIPWTVWRISMGSDMAE